jgi:hypothetical protein
METKSVRKKAKYSQTKHAKYVFEPEELQKIGTELAEKCAEKKELEDEKKSVASEFKSKTDAVDAEINILSGYLRTGCMTKKYTCDVYLDFDLGRKFYYDKLSGEEILNEQMNADDYQLELF